jgi:hypothetical protein
MSNKLTRNDYITILKFYKKTYQSLTDKQLKKQAEHILAVKLCRCIHKVSKQTRGNKEQAIAICRDSVLKKKGLQHFKYSCASIPKLLPKNKTRNILKKYKSNLTKKSLNKFNLSKKIKNKTTNKKTTNKKTNKKTTNKKIRNKKH